ncbi:hypothetical protein DVH26_17795 [Paenibacillus sp. H1-7]|uniref:hypothetical protein n=1 Tax=Paenibacillus sp. H1-7 TaxID=2282849 RepID=UPI001EF8B657|nr:hypothetical protein [Paenibacillus sp. H1-7]ULL16142.1 hypothetical protein DVH26_17795 [Paenibacillus sp. H1-7]
MAACAYEGLTAAERAYVESLEHDGETVNFVTDYFKRCGDPESSEALDVKKTARSAKEAYLDFAEARLRQFADCIDESAAVIDPYDGKERQFVTSSFALTGAVLLAAGRCAEIEDKVLATMDRATLALQCRSVPDSHEDFTTHMLMQALRLLGDRNQASGRVAEWRERLAAIDPEYTYTQVERNMPLRHVRNWATYAMLGEQMRIRDGLAESVGFIDKYISAQLPRFTPEGLYRDPNLPAAYDLAARDNLAGLLDEGYAGPAALLLEKLLRRGALTMLFTQSVTGEVSCGGRSNQFLWNELTFAHICEREAVHYKAAGDLHLAGVFKRAARRAMDSLRRWADMTEVRPVKNRFPPGSRAGYELYAFDANYLLYAGKIAASCYMHADDDILERPAPCDLGSYVLSLPSFHRIYATASPAQGGYHLCIDTAAQMGQDATGLVRLHRSGVPGETALSAGIPGAQGEVPLAFMRPRTITPPPWQAVAIGPQWRDEHGTWHRLADFGRRKHEIFHAVDNRGQPFDPEPLAWEAELRFDECRVSGQSKALTEATFGGLADDKGELCFEVIYTARSVTVADPSPDGVPPGAGAQEVLHRAQADILPRPGCGSCAKLIERYRISKTGVVIDWEVQSAEGGEVTAVAAVVPLLTTNGTDTSEIAVNRDDGVTLRYLGSEYSVKPVQQETAVERGDRPWDLELYPGLAPNRNGHYRLAEWTHRGGSSVKLLLRLEPPAAGA